MKQITTILLLLISLSGIGQVSPPTSHTIIVAGSGTSGGTTKYSTTEYGMLTDSATTGLNKFRVDSTVMESQARAVNRAALIAAKVFADSTALAAAIALKANQTALVDSAAAIRAKVFADSIDQATARLSADLIRQQITNRSYEAIVRVTSTISAAIALTSDASPTKRYLVYIPNGTYVETNIFTRAYVDLVGESTNGVIVNSSSGSTDLLVVNGGNCLIANMTLNQTNNIGDPGVTKYPIHADVSTSGAVSTTVIYKVKSNALGTNSKSGIGIGLYARQRMYIVDCEFTSQVLHGIFVHNVGSGTNGVPYNSMGLFVVNTKSTGFAYGLLVQNLGSLALSDRVAVFGGSFTGATADIGTTNSGGVGEIYVQLDPYVQYSTTSLVDATKLIKNNITSLPFQTDYNFFLSDYPELQVLSSKSAGKAPGILIKNSAAISSGNIASLKFAAWANENIVTPGAEINVTVTNAGTGGNAMSFSTKTNAAALTEKMRISSEGLLGIGTASANSTLHVAGSVATTYTASAVDITLTVAHSVINLTATTKIATLPTAVSIAGRIYTIKLSASGTGTVATTASQTIDGSTTYSLSAQYKFVTVQSDGANWIIIGNN